MALRAEERRDKLRKAMGRSTYPTIHGYLNGETHTVKPCIHTPIHNVWKGTWGTETSKYPEEEKEKSISRVAASGMERA